MAFSALLLASCGGGSASRGLVPVPSSSPTPIAAPTSSAQTAAVEVTVSLPTASPGATPEPVALPAVAGYAPTMSLPLPQTATTTQLTAVVSNVEFSSSPPLSLARSVQAARRAALPADAAPLLYIEIYSSATIVIPSAPGFTITIPSADVFSHASYYLALYDPTRPSLGWQYGFEGPGSLSGTTVTFASSPNPFTFAGALSYYFALIVVPQNTTQPTPAPSTPPTTVPTQSPPPVTTTSPTPSPAPTATPSPTPTPAPTGSASGVVVIEATGDTKP